MDPRRTAALLLMERLKRHDIESDARELGRLRAESARLDRQKEELLDRLHGESRSDDPALAAYLGNFIRSVRSEILRIEREKARIEPDLTRLEDRVAEAFREMKTYESVRLSAQAEALEEARRQEDAAAAETALGRWWRARGSSRMRRGA